VAGNLHIEWTSSISAFSRTAFHWHHACVTNRRPAVHCTSVTQCATDSNIVTRLFLSKSTHFRCYIVRTKRNARHGIRAVLVLVLRELMHFSRNVHQKRFSHFRPSEFDE